MQDIDTVNIINVTLFHDSDKMPKTYPNDSKKTGTASLLYVHQSYLLSSDTFN
jgi:hypothetical protein